MLGHCWLDISIAYITLVHPVDNIISNTSDNINAYHRDWYTYGFIVYNNQNMLQIYSNIIYLLFYKYKQMFIKLKILMYIWSYISDYYRSPFWAKGRASQHSYLVTQFRICWKFVQCAISDNLLVGFVDVGFGCVCICVIVVVAVLHFVIAIALLLRHNICNQYLFT
jgi:hypothetical protein